MALSLYVSTVRFLFVALILLMPETKIRSLGGSVFLGFHWIKGFAAGAAAGAFIIFGKILQLGAGGITVLGITDVFVVDHSAQFTYIFHSAHLLLAIRIEEPTDKKGR